MKTTVAKLLKTKKSSSLPQWIEPQLATLGQAPPSGEDWLHEIKLDGYRIIVKIKNNDVRFYSRNHLDWTAKLKAFVNYFRSLNLESGYFDGEITVLNEKGISKFQLLQNSLKAGELSDITFFIFDVMNLNGIDLRSLPLENRKLILEKYFRNHKNKTVKLTEPAQIPGQAFFKEACKAGLEGIISKRKDAPYISGRSKTWLKSKCIGEEEFVIGGFTPHSKQSKFIGALLLGEITKSEKLIYRGKVGTGFSSLARQELFLKCKNLETEKPSFESSPLLPKGAIWIRPKLIAEITFTERTKDGLLRHPSFQGLREDKTISDLKKSSDRG